MKFNIPKKFKIGGVDYSVEQVEHCGHYDDFGFTKDSSSFNSLLLIANNIA